MYGFHNKNPCSVLIHYKVLNNEIIYNSSKTMSKGFLKFQFKLNYGILTCKRFAIHLKIIGMNYGL